MLDLNKIRAQMGEFAAFHSERRQLWNRKLQRARAVLKAAGEELSSLRERVAESNPDFLVAGLREPPSSRYAAPPRPTPITVVATDGSQIYPDRHLEPTCYLLNISRVAFQYGTSEPPLLEAIPHFRFRQNDHEDPIYQYLESAMAELVSALRDEEELRQLLRTARSATVEARPLVALSDGTLIRWMLRGMRNPVLERNLIARYTGLLASFQEERIPLSSYISMPGNTEVINLLRVLEGETEETPAETSLAGPVDRHLFDVLLAPGERSATFESASHIQREYGMNDRICYFYVKCRSRSISGTALTPEVGRVEMPRWVADDADLVHQLHATILSECEKGRGYPMILSEAHEQAIIRAREREAFRVLLERTLTSDGVRFVRSRKDTSKRQAAV